MKLQIYECDNCHRPFYVPDIGEPTRCCWCGSPTEIVNTSEVEVEELNGGFRLDLSLTPLGGIRPPLVGL